MDGNTSRMITIIVGASLRIWIPSPGFIYLQTIWYQSYKVEAPVVAALHFLPAAVVGMILRKFCSGEASRKPLMTGIGRWLMNITQSVI